MKKIYSLLVFAFAVLVTNAQTKSDPEAKKILDGVSSNFKTFKSPQASFTYQVENAQGKVLSSRKGSVSMKGNKYHVTMGDLEIFSDGRTSWNYDKAANEVTVNGVDVSGSAMTPQKLFTNFYDKDFLYKLNGENKVAGKTVQEIEMTPTDKSRPFHKVYVLIDKAAKSIYSARFLEKNGNRYSYTITKLTPNAALADASFIFDKKRYPGVEVVDLR
ncbi:outer membrane lipoprotein carrier protein LolA [Chitinophagaceae bacterium LB-8]|uniref:Outer membrane lipoprotein carrier protein LolA n=1 Tax=Paraflavisolibacter caeni TaxID=2982496 RepID=A0A9X2XY26_9BACT|nr:outer membrane lipoprotein carrier protein LolA [Paraflavisolibacter caeni]MCU7550827.1 outer membrane lipoprotein carrier protein LolA [Paraflavisolibacter caeni]